MGLCQDDLRVLVSMVHAVKEGLPSFAGKGLSLSPVESPCNVVEDEVTASGPFSIPVVSEVPLDIHGWKKPVMVFWVLSWYKAVHQTFLLGRYLIIKDGVITEGGGSHCPSVMDHNLSGWSFHEALNDFRATVMFSYPCCRPPHAY